jgi:MIP family channel proteins
LDRLFSRGEKVVDKLLRPCVAEMVGTFLLTFIGGGAICTDSFLRLSGQPGIGLVGIALAHGIILAIAATAALNVSGGHINPAVTLTMLFFGRINGTRALWYIFSQLLGAVIAGFFLTIIFANTQVPNESALGTPHFAANLKKLFNRDVDLQLTALATLVELLLTFVLVFSIFGTAVDPRSPRIGGFGIGLAVLCGILVGGPLTGAAMNPARYFGTAVWEAGILQDFSRLGDCLVYILGPVIGAVLAGWVYTGYVMEEGQS